jgi:hypothetical protein
MEETKLLAKLEKISHRNDVELPYPDCKGCREALFWRTMFLFD